MNTGFLLGARLPVALILLVLAAGCAAVPQSSQQYEADSNDPAQPAVPAPRLDLFQSRADVPSFDELTRLTPAQERQFSDWFNAPERTTVKPHRRIADYLETILADVTFDDQTRGAAEALASQHGNCLSLALVTTAVSRVAGVDTDWQLTTRNPVYSSDGSVVYSANHVHTRLFDPTYKTRPGQITLRRPHVLIDYFSERPTSGGITLKHHQIIALTYQNLAAETIADGDLDRSFHLSLKGLEHDPANPELYNILGLLHKRKGAWETAEAYYRHALDVGGERLVTLRNLQRLLLTRGREAEAEARSVARRIVALPDSDPFPLIKLGDEALQRGHIQIALNYYTRARDLAPYLHEIHARIASVRFRQGRLGLARKSMREALERAGVSDKSKYKKIGKYPDLAKLTWP